MAFRGGVYASICDLFEKRGCGQYGEGYLEEVAAIAYKGGYI
jgi:hypothetical protein